MGRDSGWLALHGGIAGRADVICLPEIPYSVLFNLFFPHLNILIDSPDHSKKKIRLSVSSRKSREGTIEDSLLVLL